VVVGGGQLFFLRTAAIEYFPPFVGIFHEMLVDVLEVDKLASSIELSVEIRPLVIRNPRGGIGRNGDFSRRSREQVSPLSIIDLIVALSNLDSQNKREEQFVLFEQTSAHVFIKRIGKVVVHGVQSFLQLLRGRTILH